MGNKFVGKVREVGRERILQYNVYICEIVIVELFVELICSYNYNENVVYVCIVTLF